MAVLFAGTTMDTGLRLQRYIFRSGVAIQHSLDAKTLPATLLAVGSVYCLRRCRRADGTGSWSFGLCLVRLTSYLPG